MNEDIVYFEKGNAEKQTLALKETVDYLTDFDRLVQGEPCILPMQDVFNSTRWTLTVQQKANEE